MSLNVELLDRTLAYIEAHPEEWNQSTWRCQTGLCFAGWAVTLAGGEWAYPAVELNDGSCFLDLLIAEPEDDPETVEDEMVDVVDRAYRVLGLDGHSRGLFSATNTIDDIRRIVAEIKAEASE